MCLLASPRRLLAPTIPALTLSAALVVVAAAMTVGVLTSAGCGGTRERAHIALGAPIGAAPRQGVVSDSRGYLLLADGSMHFANEGAPQGLYVVGILEGGRFIPEGDVQGDEAAKPLATATTAPSEGNGIPGWFVLGDASFCKTNSGCRPAGPYVEGVLMPDGAFVPTSRKVKY